MTVELGESQPKVLEIHLKQFHFKSGFRDKDEASPKLNPTREQINTNHREQQNTNHLREVQNHPMNTNRESIESLNGGLTFGHSRNHSDGSGASGENFLNKL